MTGGGAGWSDGVERRLAAVAWLLLWLGFAWCIGLRDWGHWYSPSLPHRWQTEALWRGTFALQPTPHGQMADWAWGNGSQHVWGLGVGLVRFPFEAAAKTLGFAGFPDRVTLWLAFVATTLLAARAFAGTTPLARVVLVLVTVATPAFVTLCRTRLAVYEESVAYAHLWAVAMASLLLVLAERRRDGDLVAACALAGLAPLMRPTLIVDAAVTVGLAGLVRARPERRATALALGGAAFVAGLVLVGVVNFRRFGSPFETGQLLNVSYIPTDQAAKLFGYPFWSEPFRSAAAELLSSLTLPARWNAPQWYAPAIHPWQSATVRFREFYFTTFTPLHLGLLVAGWITVAAAWLAGRSAARRAALVGPPVAIGALWSCTVFAGQFVFYLWAPSMTSRYAVDFAAPFAVGMSALLLLLLRAAPTSSQIGIASLAAAANLTAIATAAIAPSHPAGPLFDAAETAAAVQRPRPEPLPLPAAYRCGDAPESAGIKFNGSGWATPGSCEVRVATMLFVPRPACVRVRVAPVTGAPPLAADGTAAIRAKLGLSEMRRVSDEPADAPADDGRALVFCTPPDHRPNPAGIELLYLGWTPPAALSPDVRPFRLLEVAEVPPP